MNKYILLYENYTYKINNFHIKYDVGFNNIDNLLCFDLNMLFIIIENVLNSSLTSYSEIFNKMKISKIKTGEIIEKTKYNNIYSVSGNVFVYPKQEILTNNILNQIDIYNIPISLFEIDEIKFKMKSYIEENKNISFEEYIINLASYDNIKKII